MKARGYVPIPPDVRRRVVELSAKYETERGAYRALGVSVEVYHDLVTPGGVLRKEVLHRVERKLVLLLSGAAAVLLLACGDKRASFASDVAACELRATCAEAVQCRLDVAKKYNRDPNTVGHCEPTDGGAP